MIAWKKIFVALLAVGVSPSVSAQEEGPLVRATAVRDVNRAGSLLE